MEKRKNLKTRLFQLGCLVAFAGMALACASKQEAVDAMDGFVDGYNSTRYGSDIEVPKDTINVSADFDYAMTNPDK